MLSYDQLEDAGKQRAAAIRNGLPLPVIPVLS
jgi:hypothetical protein